MEANCWDGRVAEKGARKGREGISLNKGGCVGRNIWAEFLGKSALSSSTFFSGFMYAKVCFTLYHYDYNYTIKTPFIIFTPYNVLGHSRSFVISYIHQIADHETRTPDQ